MDFRSSYPGHEYLEADYECAPGYYMTTNNTRLLCKNRRWVGEVPKCKVRQNPSELCAEMSCEQVCNEVDGRAQCSCFEGFRSDGRNCIGKLEKLNKSKMLHQKFNNYNFNEIYETDFHEMKYFIFDTFVHNNFNWNVENNK